MWADQRPQRAFRVGDGNVLRNQLAKEHLNDRCQAEGDDQARGGGNAGRNTAAVDQGLEKATDGWLGEHPEGHAAGRDAQLGAGELSAEVRAGNQRACGAMATLFDIGLEADVAGGEQCKLDCDEHGVDGNQQGYGDKGESGHDACPPGVASGSSRATTRKVSILRPNTATTSTRQPSSSTISLGCGRWPRQSRT